MKKILTFLAFIALAGCTDADKSFIKSGGNPSKVNCYSNGKLIYQGESTSMIQIRSYSNVLYFQEKSTNDFVQITGDCIIKTKT